LLRKRTVIMPFPSLLANQYFQIMAVVLSINSSAGLLQIDLKSRDGF
jgi:hypothetical protein